MTIPSTEKIIEFFNEDNSYNNPKLAPESSYEYARHDALVVLINSWSEKINSGNTTLNDVLNDVDITVDRLDEFKSSIKVDLNFIQDVISSNLEENDIYDKSRNAALKTLGLSWLESFKNPLNHLTNMSSSVLKSNMERDLLYTRANMLFLRSIFKTHFDNKDIDTLISLDREDNQPAPSMKI